MPNGGARDRVFVLMDSFYARYGHWPTQLRVPSRYVQIFEQWDVGGASAADRLRAKLRLVADDKPPQLVVQDDDGAWLEYGKHDSLPLPGVSSWEWLGVKA
jgi:hypothetical protein